MRLIDRPCPICGTAAAARLQSDSNVDEEKLNQFAFASRKTPEYMHYRMLHCTTCDVLYADFVPDGEQLCAAYRDAAFDSGDAAKCAARTYGRLLLRLTLPDKSDVLDVGTGDGAFLEELLGFGFKNVIGIEPSTAPIAAAATHIRPLIRQQWFGPGVFPSGSQSLVCCLQTIEHLLDPLTCCRQIMELLKPGGAILITCHNRRSVVNRLLAQWSPIMDIEHLQLFSPASVRNLLEKVGYRNISVHRYVNRYPFNYWLRLLPLPRKLKSVSMWVATKTRIGSLPLPTPAGNMVVVGYRPIDGISRSTAISRDRRLVPRAGLDSVRA